MLAWPLMIGTAIPTSISLLCSDGCGIAFSAMTAPSAFADNIVVILLCKRGRLERHV